MKICPQCQTSYTDDSLQFCLQDGTPLHASQPTVNNWGESETLVSPAQHDKIRVDLQNSPPQQQTWTTTPDVRIAEPAPKKSNTGLTVAITALLTLLVAGGLGAFLFMRGGNQEVAQNTNSKPVNAAVPSTPRTNVRTSNVNAANSNLNSNINSNVNTAPSATPSPRVVLNPQQIKNIESDIENTVDDWKDATEKFDLNAQMANYADTVDYYRAGRVGIGAIRADKQRAFGPYDSIKIDISNIRVTTDDSGVNATALFDKEWTFEGDEKLSQGKVQQQLQFTNIDGKWRITGERDLRVYYTR